MNLKDYLRENNIKQVDFAKKIGKLKPNLSSWINGRSKPIRANQQLIHDATDGKVTFEDWK